MKRGGGDGERGGNGGRGSDEEREEGEAMERVGGEDFRCLCPIFHTHIHIHSHTY